MNLRFNRCSLLTAILLLAVYSLSAAPEEPSPAPSAKTVARSRQIKERIDSLFAHRLKPEPLPVILPNPFLVVGGVVDSGHSDESVPAPEPQDNKVDPSLAAPVAEPAAANDAAILARHILSLKIGGTVQLNGQLRVSINQTPRKEGDLIFMEKKDTVTYLKVIRITPSELTLGFNDAVQVIRLKN